MSSSHSNSPDADDDGYFNDLGRNTSHGTQNSSTSPVRGDGTANAFLPPDGGADAVPRPKRIACVVCRKRKLRCDGSKPSCGTCSRLGHDCAYDEVRRKSGPKRGYVKQLEARLAQVETMLKTQDPADEGRPEPSATAYADLSPGGFFEGAGGNLNFGLGGPGAVPDFLAPREGLDGGAQPPLEGVPLDGGLGAGPGLSWEMIGLGIDEPLPSQDVIDELYHIYFTKIHPSEPIIHRRRFMAAMNLSPASRPPVCLRYIMWCLAASVSDRYMGLQDHFYQRARKYVELDEMKGHGQTMITIAHSQCWSLISTYEFKLMYFPRAWMSTGRAVRLAQMMGLHRLDGVGLDVKQCLPPPKDWTEREERRRTFWMAFCQDRYASIGTGWPLVVEESDILTNLPASEEAFERSRPQRTLTLREAMTPDGAASLSGFAGVVLMASLFGHNLIHLHRPDPNDNDDDLNGAFWRRHRHMDAILANTSLSLPPHLRLPAGLGDANVVFLNMNIHTSTICLHQAAIFKADKNRLPGGVSVDSKVRCVTAAAEIASIMRTVSHLDLSAMNPFISFCLYVAARVFVQYIKSRPDDEQVRASLQFLLSAMQVLKKKNPLTESFLVQLDVDLEGSGLDDPTRNAKFHYGLKKGVAEVKGAPDTTDCCPLLNPQQTQTQAAPIYTADSPDRHSPLPDLPDSQTYQGQTWFAPENTLDLPNRFKSPAGARPRPSPHLSPGLADMDLTPDASTASGSDQAGRPSPATSHSTSARGGPSQSAYTPPGYDETQFGGGGGGGMHVHPPMPLMQDGGYLPLHRPAPGVVPPPAPVSGSFLPATPGKEADGGAFVIPPGWDLGGTGLTPASTDGMFGQLMDMGIPWDGVDGTNT
ncbi:MAG: hypothetical protein M1832_005088 [Thelocarpon impressellum]|nr:MAG: hypothetical protein M1832_005088 [Thelocarpon impressellum]